MINYIFILRQIKFVALEDSNSFREEQQLRKKHSNQEKDYLKRMKNGCGWTSLRDEEFQESDVWEVFKKTKDSDFSAEEPQIIAKRLPTKAQAIPKYIATSQEHQIRRQSAPVAIPDWSRLYGSSPKNASSAWLDVDHANEGRSSNNNADLRRKSWYESEDEEERYMVPPHEWVARKMAASFSVCEGAGRTLKGRDLSRVRNSVLTKTGFLEPKSDCYY